MIASEAIITEYATSPTAFAAAGSASPAASDSSVFGDGFLAFFLLFVVVGLVLGLPHFAVLILVVFLVRLFELDEGGESDGVSVRARAHARVSVRA